ncbi:MAG: amidohydrolase [Synergistaceae bacterium]|jgi:amidohydrolase|nr:amidohydrolase [Synergistaceae bacterium]
MKERVKEVRDYLHASPEASGQEEKTAAYLAEELRKAGYEVRKVTTGGHGVVGILKGAEPGSVVGVRGDIDALRHVVDGKEVCVHSCGHDAHAAMALALAEETAKAGIKRGTLKVFFQPAEETLMGARGMIEAGLTADLDYMFGIHLRPIQEAKAGQATAALWHGASYKMEASISGRTAHGARPHLGVNAIDAAVLVVNALNCIWENPVEGWSAKVTKFNSNSLISNAVPDGVDLVFDLRAQKNAVMESMLQKIGGIVTSVPAGLGAVGTVKNTDGVPAAEYDDEAIALLEEAIVATLGQDGLLPPIVTPGADDFHFYKKAKPSIKAAFIGLGANLAPGLHDPSMTFDENVLPGGVNILKHAVNRLLG